MGNNEPFNVLTIAIPAYNIGDYVERAISSLAKCRSLSLLDILVINDGSTDATGEIAKACAKLHPENVRVVDKENSHYGSAINRAIDEARGTYFKILDGDDEYHADGLDALVAFLVETLDSPDMVITDYEVVYEQTGVKTRYSQELTPMIATSFDAARLSPCAMHSLTYKTSVLKAMGDRLDEGVAFTDVEFTLFPLSGVETVAYCDSLVYSYKIGREGQSVDIACIDRNMPSHELVLKHCIDWFERIEGSLSAAKRDYVAVRLAGMLDDHVHRCLLSKDPDKWLSGLKEIVARCKACRPIIRNSKSLGLKLLRTTCFLAYKPMNRFKRRSLKA